MLGRAVRAAAPRLASGAGRASALTAPAAAGPSVRPLSSYLRGLQPLRHTNNPFAKLLRRRPAQQQRRAFLGQRRIRNLEQEANGNAADPEAQAAYLRELNKVRPAEVCRRVDSGAFASNEAVMKEYVKALVATGRLDHVRLADITAPDAYRAAAGHYGGGYGGTVGGFNPAAAAAPAPPPMAAGLFPSSGAPAAGGTGSGPYTGFAGAAHANHGAAYGVAGAAGTAAPVMVKLVEPDARSKLLRFIQSLIPVGLILGLTYYAINSQTGGLGGSVKGKSGMFGMMAAQELKPQTSDKTFDDVKGCDEAKAELQEIAEYLADPEKFTTLGGKLPKGVLLMGAPGTGKTLLARAIAGEAGVPFFYTSGSEFDEIFVGMGAKRVRELFAAAKAKTPCIVFIDEIDAVGGKRSAKDQQAMKQTLNQVRPPPHTPPPPHPLRRALLCRVCVSLVYLKPTDIIRASHTHTPRSCWSSSTASRRTKGSSSSGPPTFRTRSTRPWFGRAASIGTSTWHSLTCAGARPS